MKSLLYPIRADVFDAAPITMNTHLKDRFQKLLRRFKPFMEIARITARKGSNFSTYLLPALLWLVATPISSRGGTVHWSNPKGGNWGVAANWTPTQVPTLNDDVLIDLAGSYSVTQNVNAAAANLTIGDGSGSQRLFANNRTLNVAQTLHIQGGASFNENNNLTGSVVRVEGRLDWTGGTLISPTAANGSLLIEAAGECVLTNAQPHTLSRFSITNNGTFRWRQGNLQTQTGTNLFVNTGNLLIDASANTTWSSLGSTSNRFINLAGGHLVKSAAANASWEANLLNQGIIEVESGLQIFSAGGNNAGNVILHSGGSLNYSDGSFLVNGGTLSGSGTNLISGASTRVEFQSGASFAADAYLLDISAGQVVFNTGTPLTVPSIRLRGGALRGTDTLTVSGKWAWNGGTFGGLTLLATGGMDLISSTSSSFAFESGRIENRGPGQWIDANLQSQIAQGNATLANYDQLQISGGISWTMGTTAGAHFVNVGTVRFLPSVQPSSFTPSFENVAPGRLEVTNTTLTLGPGTNSGTISLASTAVLKFGTSPSAFTFQNGASVEGDGELQIAGATLVVAPNVQIPASAITSRVQTGELRLNNGSRWEVGGLYLSGGAVTGPGELAVTQRTLWGGTDLRTNIFLNSLGGILISNPVAHSLSEAIIRNGGNGNWVAGNITTLRGTVIITNAPGASFVVSDGIRWAHAASATNIFVNEGLFLRDSGSGTATFDSSFFNRGTVDLRSTFVLEGLYQQESGVTRVEFATLRANGGLNLLGGRLEGNGDIDATVTSSGILSPGASPGQLHFLRDLVLQAGSILQIELAGTAADAFDSIRVDHAIQLNGEVQVSYSGGFVPQPPQTFAFLSNTGAKSGNFANLSFPAGPPYLDLTEDPNGATLQVIQNPPAFSFSLSANSGTINAEQYMDVEIVIHAFGGTGNNVTFAVQSDLPSLVGPSNVSFLGSGRFRTMRIRPNITQQGNVNLTVSAQDATATLFSVPFQLTVTPAPAQGTIVYEPFDYSPVGSPLVSQSGGFGFSGAWFSVGSFTIGSGSLPYPSLSSAGQYTRVGVSATAQTQMRRLSTRLGLPFTSRYVSYLARPGGTLGAGAVNGYFGLLLDTTLGSDLFVGKPGGGDTARWVVEDAGGVGQISTRSNVIVGAVTLLVLKIEFLPGNDRISLFLNPTPGQPEPATPLAVRTDRDLGDILNIGFTSTGQWEADELRVGTTWESATPDSQFLAPLAFQPIPDQNAQEGAAFQFTPNLQFSVIPRIPHFELLQSPTGMSIDALSGAISWTPDETQGNTTRTIRIRVHDTPEPPARSSDIQFQIVVQESNEPPGIAISDPSALIAAPGSPFRFQLGSNDNDIPPNTVTFAKTPGKGPATLTVSPSGLVEWTPDASEPPGFETVYVDVTDFNPLAPPATQHLTSHTQFDIQIVGAGADLETEGLSIPAVVSQDQSSIFQFKVRNHGPSIATHTQFRFRSPDFITQPPHLTLNGSVSSRGTCQLQGNQVTCDLGDLAVGEVVDISLTLAFPVIGTVTYSYTSVSDLPDSNLSNTGQSSAIAVNEPPPPNPLEVSVLHAEDLGETGHGACLATDANRHSHAVWFNASTKEIHHGFWNGLRWFNETIDAPFNATQTPANSVVLDAPTPLSIALDESGYLHVAASLQDGDGNRKVVYLKGSPNPIGGISSWVLQTVFNGSANAPLMEVGAGSNPRLRIWFVSNQQLHIAESTAAGWSVDSISLPGTWTVLDSGTPLSPVSPTQAFLAGSRPNGEVVLLLATLSGLNASVEEKAVLATDAQRPIHLSAMLQAGSPAVAFTRYPANDPRHEIAFLHLENGNWVTDIVESNTHCGRPSLSLDQDGKPILLFSRTEQTAYGTPTANEDRFYRRLWILARKENAWTSQTVFKSEDVTPSLSLAEKSLPLVYAEDPSLALSRRNGIWPHMVFHTGYPNNNLIFGHVQPRWTQMPVVEHLSPPQEVEPVLTLDLSGMPHIAWSDKLKTGNPRLEHRWLNSDLNYLATPETPVPGTIHQAGLIVDRQGAVHAVISSAVPPFAVESLNLRTDGVWEDHVLPNVLLPTTNRIGLFDIGNHGSANDDQPGLLALGADAQYRPIAAFSGDLQNWSLPSNPNTLSPGFAAPWTTVSFASAKSGRIPTASYMAYVAKDTGYHIRIARFTGGAWDQDRIVADNLPDEPMLDLAWMDHPPYGTSENGGYLYLVYTTLLNQRFQQIHLLRSPILENAALQWIEVPLLNVQPDYIENMRLAGAHESFRLALRKGNGVELVSAEGISDTNQLAQAQVERVPIAGQPRQIDMAVDDTRTWIAYANLDPADPRVDLIVKGGIDAGNQPRSEVQFPITAATSSTYRSPFDCQGDSVCACFVEAVELLAFFWQFGFEETFYEYHPKNSPLLSDRPAPPITLSTFTRIVPTFLKVRDVMLQTAEGKRWVDMYYQLEPLARKAADAHPELYGKTIQMSVNFLPGLAGWLEGRGTQFTLNQGMIDQLRSLWLSMAAVADPELKTALLSEIVPFHNLQDFAGKNMDEWAALLHLPSTANATIRILQSEWLNSTFRVTIPLDSTKTYQLQRKLNLEDAAWIPVLNATQELQGAQRLLIDPTPGTQRGFYRVVAQ